MYSEVLGIIISILLYILDYIINIIILSSIYAMDLEVPGKNIGVAVLSI